jgi:DNA-binding NarL/FixJ family response regulator
MSKPAQPDSVAAKSRVFVVDDHPLICQGLSMLIELEPDLTVCGTADGASSALSALPNAAPDVLVLDISLEGPDGLDLLKIIRARTPNLPVLIFSMHDESIYAERAMRAGANGYIMKQEATAKLLAAIRRVLRGEVYLSERLTNMMIEQFVHGASLARTSPLVSLTDRELEVYRLIGEGRGTRQIADELHLSVKTIESYQAHIKEKLALRNARELVQHAIEWSVNLKSG